MTWTTQHSPHNAPAGTHILQAMRLSPHADLAWTTRDGSEYMIHAAPRPPVAAPGIAGLYFVGETSDVPAVQMDAAALSALTAADLIGASRQP